MRTWWSVLFLLVWSGQLSEGANILAMFPLPFFSHTNAYKPMIRELAKRGHNVTFVSPYPDKTPQANLQNIVIPDLNSMITAGLGKDAFVRKTNGITDFIIMFVMGNTISKTIFSEPSFQNFLHDSTSNFDLVICETFFMQEFMLAFGHKYNAPVINFNPVEPFSTVSYYTGNLQPYSYVASPFLVSTDRMTFVERLKNTVTNIFELLLIHTLYLCLQESWMRTYMNETNGFSDLPPLKQMLRNTSLTLVDSHFSVGYQRPYHTNIVEFGGITLKDPDPLPQDLQNYMDNAPNGVIYFSFGSHFDVDFLPDENHEAIFTALSQVKQNVIMKWKSKTKQQVASNIKILDWLPQQSILAHRNCKLFITHGGLHGNFEAIHHGVPILGIPIFGDQPRNLKFIEYAGLGISLDRFDMNSTTILDAINKILTDPSYKKAAEQRSRIERDRLVPPLQNAIFWIEYVIRHNGAYHLKPGSLDLYLYEFLLLDVIAVLAIIVFILTLALYLWLKCVRWVCCRKKKPEVYPDYKKYT